MCGMGKSGIVGELPQKGTPASSHGGALGWVLLLSLCLALRAGARLLYFEGPELLAEGCSGPSRIPGTVGFPCGPVTLGI